MLDKLVSGLLPHVDLFLAETTSCVAEALAACNAVRRTSKPIWVSFTLAEQSGLPLLRSNEAVTDAVAAASARTAAILFNRSPPEVMGEALEAAGAVLDPDGPPVGVYANAFAESRSGASATLG